MLNSCMLYVKCDPGVPVNVKCLVAVLLCLSESFFSRDGSEGATAFLVALLVLNSITLTIVFQLDRKMQALILLYKFSDIPECQCKCLTTGIKMQIHVLLVGTGTFFSNHE